MSNILVERYAYGGPLLSFASSNLGDELARKRVAPGVLSILEMVVHLLDADLQFAHRMKQIIAEDNPTLQAYDHDAWLENISLDGLDLMEAVELFSLHRRWTARILRRLDDAAFKRTGQHSESGRKTLADILAYSVSHLDHHLKFLYGKRGNLGVALEPKYAANLVLPKSKLVLEPDSNSGSDSDSDDNDPPVRGSDWNPSINGRS